MLGKSIAPYWTAVEPVQELTGHYRKYWGMAGGAVGVMYDLSEIEWEKMAPPEGYPDAQKAQRQ